MPYGDLNYRPDPGEIKREAEAIRNEILKLRSNASKDSVPPDRRIPTEVSDMDNDQRNDYILEYNRGKIEPTLDNTIRVVEVILAQSESVQDRAKNMKEHLRDQIGPISTANAPVNFADDMKLLYGADVDTTQLTPDQILCAANAVNIQTKFIEKNQEQADIVSDVLGDEKSPLSMPEVPQSKKEFQEMMQTTFDDKNLFKWNIFTFLIMLLKIVLETVIMFIFKPICKIKIIKIKIGKMIAEGIKIRWITPPSGGRWRIKTPALAGPITLLGLVINKKMQCNSVANLNLAQFVRARMEQTDHFIRRGGIFDINDLGDDFDPDEDSVPKDLDDTPPFCPGGTRMPTGFEMQAASNMIEFATTEAKGGDNDKFKDFFGMMASASAEEESVVLSASCGNMHDKMSMIRKTGVGAADLAPTSDTPFGRMNKAIDSAIVKYIQTITETLRNIDMMVSGALELEFLSERWKDTICCFIRLLYALLVGNDDFKVGKKQQSIQDAATDWQAQYEKEGEKVAGKVKLIAEVADLLLSTFTTTVSTNFEVKLGDFSIPQLGQFVISVIRKAVFEALVAMNEYLFGGLRRLVFGAINSVIKESEELSKAMKECVIFDILINWINCLLNFLQNKVLQLLQKIRGEGDVAWGQIEINLDFAFQNKQITFLRDLLKLIGKWAFKIVSICNINNIKDDDAFIDLVETVTKDLGMDAYNPYDVRDDEYFSFGVNKSLATSVMRPGDDHSHIDSNMSNFLRKDKGNFGLFYKNNIVVDQDGKTSDNIHISPLSAPGATPQSVSKTKALKAEGETVVVPPSLSISKEDFVKKCTRVYRNVGEIIKSDKRLRSLFDNYDVYNEFTF